MSAASTKAWLARERAANSPAYQRQLAGARERKERYRGACEICGKPTNGSDGPGKAPTLCVAHNNALTGLKRRGDGPVMAQAVALLSERPMRFTELRVALGISKGRTANLFRRLLRYGLAERVSRGLYTATDDCEAVVSKRKS